MDDFEDDLNALDAELGGLGQSLAGATQMTAAFQREISNVKGGLFAAEQDASRFSKSLSGSLRGAFGDLVFEGDKLSDVLKNVARSMIETTFNRAVSPVTDALAGVVTTGIGNLVDGLLPFENGAAFSSGRVMPFAKGGVVTSPTHFPMRGATGLMGEAGPEAIMPLSRGADGSLGVRSSSQAGVSVTMNITTPDVAGFNRSRSQVAANVSRAIQLGQKNF